MFTSGDTQEFCCSFLFLFITRQKTKGGNNEKAGYGIEYTKHALDNQRGFRHILVLIDPNKPGALDGAYFEEQENQAPYAPFLP